jgi:rhomboid protease GluP
MTAECLVVCVAVFLGSVFQAIADRAPFEDVQRTWGAICSLRQPVIHDGVRRSFGSDLHGPLDVWSQEWWRIPATAFHHVNMIHLSLNLAGAWYLGYRLEQRWGSFTMALFLIPAVCIPIMSELCFGNAVLGFSGATCAMLGALTVLRQYDDKLAMSFPFTAVEMGAGIIALGCVLTLFDLFPCANVAHLTGFCYGAAIAFLTGGPLRHVLLIRISIIISHVWILPCLFLVMNPHWIGRYHWYQATSVRSPQRAEKFLEQAINCDPSLAGAWLLWSQVAERRGDLPEAWKRLIEGISHNPSNPSLMDSTRRLWRHLDSSQRRGAELILVQTFGRRSGAWLGQIRKEAYAKGIDSDDETSAFNSKVEPSEWLLDQKVQLIPWRILREPLELPENVNELQFNNAQEGEQL